MTQPSIDPFHPSSDYSRVKDVMARSKLDDLRELQLDKQALEEKQIEDKREFTRLEVELERIKLLLDQQGQRVAETRSRLQTRIRTISELELELSE